MQRRTLIGSVLTWISLRGSSLWAQAPSFPGKYESALKELAATVLPQSLGRSGTDAVALQFVKWVNEYRAGAEMQTGYGFTRVRYKPASPGPRYVEQLGQLASGALAQPDLTARRLVIAQALEEAKVKDLPFVPDGAHVVSDLMAFYFQSSEANDAAYLAKVGRDQCRGLKHSSDVPAALKTDGARARV